MPPTTGRWRWSALCWALALPRRRMRSSSTCRPVIRPMRPCCSAAWALCRSSHSSSGRKGVAGPSPRRCGRGCASGELSSPPPICASCSPSQPFPLPMLWQSTSPCRSSWLGWQGRCCMSGCGCTAGLPSSRASSACSSWCGPVPVFSNRHRCWRSARLSDMRWGRCWGGRCRRRCHPS